MKTWTGSPLRRMIAQRSAIDDDGIRQMMLVAKVWLPYCAFSRTSTPTTCKPCAAYVAGNGVDRRSLALHAGTSSQKKFEVDGLAAQSGQRKCWARARSDHGGAGSPTRATWTNRSNRRRRRERMLRRTGKNDGGSSNPLSHSWDNLPPQTSCCICSTSSATSGKRPLFAHVPKVPYPQLASVDRGAKSRSHASTVRRLPFELGLVQSRRGPHSRALRSVRRGIDSVLGNQLRRDADVGRRESQRVAASGTRTPPARGFRNRRPQQPIRASKISVSNEASNARCSKRARRLRQPDRPQRP